MALSFRDAGHDDVPVVAALVQSAFRGDASRAGWTTEADLLDGQRTDSAALADIVDSETGALVVAEDAGDLIGAFHFARPVHGAAYVGMVAVRPTLQATGIGRALLAEAERRASDLGSRRIRMTVIRQRTELIAWYERLGYLRTGETEPFPYGDERYGIPRVGDLEFVVLEKALT